MSRNRRPGWCSPAKLVNSQAGIDVVRSRNHAWTERPSTALLLASAGTVAAAFALALSGTLMASLPPTAALAAAATVLAGAVVADLLKVRTFKALGLHRLWRTSPMEPPGYSYQPPATGREQRPAPSLSKSSPASSSRW